MRPFAFLIVLLAAVSPADADVVLVNESITRATFQAGANESYTVITVKIKGDRRRTDIEVKGVVGSPLDSSTIVDGSNGTVVRLAHARKTYDRVTAEEQERQIAATRDLLSNRGTLPTSRPVLKPTGRTNAMRGYQVAEYTATRAQGNMTSTLTYWLAPSLARFVTVLAQVADPVAAVLNLQFPDPAAFAGVPVQTIIDQRMAMGQVLTTINLLSLEEKAVADSEFAIPRDYVEAAPQRPLARP